MPIVGLIGAGIGLYQSIAGGIKANKSQKDLENQAKNFQPNSGIMDYYNKALAKYSPNPYNSAGYQQQNNQINRNLATGINAAQGKRLGLGAIAGLTQQANDASAKAAGVAEQQQNQNLAQLGQAASAKTNEQQKKFDMLYNLTAAKAGAGASQENTGISNLYSGIASYGQMKQLQDSTGSGGYGGISAYRMPRNNYYPELSSYYSRQ